MNVLASAAKQSRGAILALGMTLAYGATPASANHEPDYAERVRYCATLSYALVESIITVRESIDVAIDATGALPNANDQRLMDVVARATGAGAARMFDNFSECLIALSDDLVRDVDANLAAQGIAVEVDFAIEEINGVFAAIDEGERALRQKWGTAGNANAATAVQSFRDFAFDLEGYLEEARDFVAVLVERTTPEGVVPPPDTPRRPL